MEGKYLITTDEWFIAPDGQQYKAVWGEVKILGDEALGVKTNRNSTNWYARVGNDNDHIIIAGCQIHYAFKSEETPSDQKVKDWSLDANNFNQKETPTRIYFID